MSQDRVRAGVIGVGSMGQHHARVYSELRNVELVGVTDLDTARAASVAAKHGTIVMDQTSLLEAANVVSVAVPTPYHADVVSDCIDAGVHALVEKPFVDDIDTGRTLASRARAAGVTIQVGHVERFNPAVRALADIVDDLDVIAVSARRLGPPLDRDVDDNAVMDLMIHDIDVVLSLVDGDLVDVDAAAARGEAYATAQLQFDDGVVGTLTASRVTQEKVRTLDITARDAWIAVDYLDQSVEIHRHSLPEYLDRDGELRYRHEGIVERPMVDSTEPLKEELAAFVEVASEGGEPRVTAEDGLRALSVARRIEEQIYPEPRDVVGVEQS